MPVPTAHYTTFARFREHLISIGCAYGPLVIGFSRDPLVYFENPKSRRPIPPSAVMKKLADDDEVKPTVIRSVCDQLDIDPAEFGFTYP